MFSLQGLHDHRDQGAEDQVQGGVQPGVRQVPQAPQRAGPGQQAICPPGDQAQATSERQRRIQGEQRTQYGGWVTKLNPLMFQDVKARIYVEYERNKGNREYQDARSNFQYLHEKLAHIKKLVHDYDTAGVAAR